jgi:hypothetical protein
MALAIDANRLPSREVRLRVSFDVTAIVGEMASRNIL